MKSYLNGDVGGDRISTSRSEPGSTRRSQEGYNGCIEWRTPTTVAPIFRASFAGGSADSVPTVTPMTPSQSRIASMMIKRKRLKRMGKHYTPPSQTPSLYNRNAPSSAMRGPREPQYFKQLSGSRSKGNMGDKEHHGSISSIIEPMNQADIASPYPNPIEPLPPNDPIEQQGNEYKNFRGALTDKRYSKNFPVLSDNRGLDRNWYGKGKEMGPFDTDAAGEEEEAAIDAITWL